jgi:membrane associated rhomboid family serine protease
MFIPFGFEHMYERRPFATAALVLANALAYFLPEYPKDDANFGGYALDPKHFHVVQLVTSQFLHVGVAHLLGNMLFLWVFGRYVEDRLGPWRFLLVYLACGLAGDLAYLASGADRPSVGASGAISGLMGYVLVAAPWLEARVILTMGTYMTRSYELAVGWLLVPWMVWELLTIWLLGTSTVAVAAHIGGFAFGAGAAAFMRSSRCKGTAWYIDPLPPRGGKAALDRLHQARGARRERG